MRISTQLIVAGALVAALAVPVIATNDVHVSPTGSDVTGDGSPGNPYRTISFAASAASPGDALILAAGTYGDDDQIVLGNKDLSIIGAGRGATIVRPHATAFWPLPTGFVPGSLVDHGVGIVVDGPARVDISHLTIDGAFRVPTSTLRAAGLVYRQGADGLVLDVEIVNIRTEPLGNGGGTVGVLVRGDDPADSSVVRLRECDLREWGRAGAAVYFDADLEMDYCVVRGAGPIAEGGPAQNGIQIGYGATARVAYCTVADCAYEPGTYTAAGILAYDAGAGVVIEGNSVARCEESIFLAQSTPMAAAATVRGNRVSAAVRFGMRIDGQSGVVVTDNQFHAEQATLSAAYDDASGGNTWARNSYSDWDGVGSYHVLGGASIDAAPKRGVGELGSGPAVMTPDPPIDILTSDFDSDGVRDMAILSFTAPPSLDVAFGSSGSGGFSYTVTPVPFGSVNDSPVALVSGEFDGNPGVDVAVLTENIAISGSHMVFVFANDGVGNFSLLHSLALPATIVAPSDMAAGDLDGGVDDLVVSDGSLAGGAVALLNQANGTAFLSVNLGGLTGAPSVAVGIADLGDLAGAAPGAGDIVVAEGDGGSGSLTLLVGDGMGGFTLHPRGPFVLSPGPTSLVTSDLNSDGLIDVSVACLNGMSATGAGSVVSLVNELPLGMARFVSSTDVGPIAIAAGEVGLDSDPDTTRPDLLVATGTSGDLTLLGGFGSVGFEAGGLHADGLQFPRAVAIDDMNGDGYGDAIVADSAAFAVKILYGGPVARQDLYGPRCEGTARREPLISPVGGTAIAGNFNFGIAVSNVRPLATTILGAANQPASSLASCGPLIANLDLLLTFFSGVSGEVVFPVPLPNDPTLQGFQIFVQWGVFDPEGTYAPYFAVSEGLMVIIG